MRKILTLTLPMVLAACGGTTNTRPVSTPAPATPSASVTPPPTNPTPPAVTGTSGFRAPRVMNLPGVDGLIGANADRLTRQFGTPQLDVREGDARKLQFTGEACVLDVYLYPLSPGAEPTATYVDARRASDGLDVDRVLCVRALLAQ